MSLLQGYKCHLASEIIESNQYNERSRKAMNHVQAVGGNRLVSAEEANVIITMGGDGAMLKTIQHYHKKLGNLDGKTFFGFAFGTLNFLMNDFNWEDIDEMLSGQKPLQNVRVRSLLMETNEQTKLAVNDIVVGGGDLMSWLNFNVEDEESVFGSFQGTGLIASTAVGSTAWNKNNGGVVLPLLSSNISVTGVGTNRIIKEVIHAQDIKVTFKSRSDCYIWVDGRDGMVGPLKEGTVTIKPGPWLNLGFFDAQKYQVKRRQ